MHSCINLMCQQEDTASAVLLWAGRVIEGGNWPWRAGAAGGRDGPDLARGPARLYQAHGITRAHDGADVCEPAGPLQARVAVLAHGRPHRAGVRP
jgi:DNA-3-methyladenine glycosylase